MNKQTKCELFYYVILYIYIFFYIIKKDTSWRDSVGQLQLLVYARHVALQRFLLSELPRANSTLELRANAARVHQMCFQTVLAHRTSERLAASGAKRRVGFISSIYDLVYGSQL